LQKCKNLVREKSNLRYLKIIDIRPDIINEHDGSLLTPDPW
jgi:hypothetical protein